MKRRTLAAAVLGMGALAYTSGARAQTPRFDKAADLYQLIKNRDRLTLMVATVSTMRVVLAISLYGEKTSGEKIVNDPIFNELRTMLLSPQRQESLLEAVVKDPDGVNARLDALREQTLQPVLERLTNVLREACGTPGSSVAIEFRQTFVQFTELVEVSQPKGSTPAGKGWWCNCYGLSVLCG